jgi:hypothetical protein
MLALVLLACGIGGLILGRSVYALLSHAFGW